MLTLSNIALALRPPRVDVTPWVRPTSRGWRAAICVRRDGRFVVNRYSATLDTKTAAYGLARDASRQAEIAVSDLVTTCRLTLAAWILAPLAVGWLLATAL